MVNYYTFEKIFKEYEEANDKQETIIQLSKKCDISVEGLLKLLLDNGYKIPMDLLEEIQEGYIEPEPDDTDDDELYSAIAIEKYWEERWKDLDDIEKAMRRHEYIKEKFHINDFGVYCFIQDFIIKNSGVNGLLADVERAVKGVVEKQVKPQQVLEDVKTRWMTRILNELSEEDNQDKPYAVQMTQIYYDKIKPLLDRVIGNAKARKLRERMLS